MHPGEGAAIGGRSRNENIRMTSQVEVNVVCTAILSFTISRSINAVNRHFRRIMHQIGAYLYTIHIRDLCRLAGNSRGLPIGNKHKLDAGVMEAITKGPAFGDRKLLLACLIVKNPRVLNSRTIGVMMMKRKLLV
jgi:hypothetical protein